MITQQATEVLRLPQRPRCKSNGIRPTRLRCKLHGVGYVQRYAKANSASEEPCLQGCVPMGLLGSDDKAPQHERSASVAYRLPPPCWPRRATSRSIHLELLIDLGYLSKPELQQIYPRCLYDFSPAAVSGIFPNTKITPLPKRLVADHKLRRQQRKFLQKTAVLPCDYSGNPVPF